MNAIVVDTIGALVIAGGCATVAGCVPAIEYALAIDLGMSLFSPLAIAGNVLDPIGFALTFVADWINGTTYIKRDSSGSTIGIGRDTVVSFKSLVKGQVPEANFAAWVSNEQLKYDNQRISGELQAVTQYVFKIPNLWGKTSDIPAVPQYDNMTPSLWGVGGM